MYFAILRSTNNTKLPPALLRSEGREGLSQGLHHYKKEGWECVFLLEGEELHDLDAFLEEGHSEC